MKVDPYLSFEGRCEEAIEFYRIRLGAKVEMLMRFKDAPADEQAEGCGPDMGGPPPDSANKVLHSSLLIGQSRVMATDGQCTGKPGFTGISLALAVKNDAEAQKVFAALSEGGQVQMPLTKTFFSSSFGMVADPFGVSWMIVVEA
jgi:PhnB protein